ncbi:MAG: ferrous iron transport protein A [Candidatus Marinimicrobia bacterium]|nr:ferrous iron transport protein A [Candidatus Neomarinimicrobiota bacterium]
MTEDQKHLLSQLKPGQHFTVQKVNAKGEIRRRLVDIGFLKEEKGVVIREALFCDPIEVEIKNTKVSLRRSEAEMINIKVMEQ